MHNVCIATTTKQQETAMKKTETAVIVVPSGNVEKTIIMACEVLLAKDVFVEKFSSFASAYSMLDDAGKKEVRNDPRIVRWPVAWFDKAVKIAAGLLDASMALIPERLPCYRQLSALPAAMQKTYTVPEKEVDVYEPKSRTHRRIRVLALTSAQADRVFDASGKKVRSVAEQAAATVTSTPATAVKKKGTEGASISWDAKECLVTIAKVGTVRLSGNELKAALVVYKKGILARHVKTASKF